MLSEQLLKLSSERFIAKLFERLRKDVDDDVHWLQSLEVLPGQSSHLAFEEIAPDRFRGELPVRHYRNASIRQSVGLPAQPKEFPLP